MEVVITDLNNQGKGICYVDNKITFVNNVLIGEEVEIEITNSTSKYNLAKVIRYIKKSDNRVNSYCPYYDKCGGCNLCLMSYKDTIKFKKNKLKNILWKFAKIDKDIKIIESKSNINYRNKITLKIKDGKIGYFEEKTNEIVEITKCMIASNSINEFIPYISEFEVNNGEIVIRSNYNNELLINFITNDPVILPKLPNLKIVGILHNGNILYGNNIFIEIIDNKFFQVSYDSFFQINKDICLELFNLVKKYIISNKNVVDLYCGVGTLGITVAGISDKVYGIEIVKNAIINAISNAKMNKVKNVEYMLGDSKLINKIKDIIDIVIVDPPRSGLTNDIIDIIKEKNIKRIIYISCDPITLSRDINLLKDKYVLNYIVGLDMFPYTHHVETFTILDLKE